MPPADKWMSEGGNDEAPIGTSSLSDGPTEVRSRRIMAILVGQYLSVDTSASKGQTWPLSISARVIASPSGP
jgi:hypothetical protein